MFIYYDHILYIPPPNQMKGFSCVIPIWRRPVVWKANFVLIQYGVALPQGMAASLKTKQKILKIIANIILSVKFAYMDWIFKC